MIRQMLFGLLVIAAATSVVALGEEPQGLVVHEWGVWVRTSTDHGTRWGSPEEMVKQLPPFVRVVKSESPPKRQDQGWDKPVIHLYGPDGLAVNLKIGTPQGHPTAYFPAASLTVKEISVTDAGDEMIYTLTDCLGLDWSGTIAAKPQGELPKVAAGHWWGRTRQVPSAYFRSKDSEERFLFYEATAFQEPVVVGEMTAEELTLTLSRPAKNPFLPETGERETEPVGPVLVIVNNGTKRWIQRIDTITAKQPVKLKKSDVLRTPATVQEILAAAESQWQSYGLTKHETAAIVEAWKPDLLGTLGFLVISRMPPPLYEEMFPVAVTPKPKEIVRAGVVFDTLPGCMERLSWLPELRKLFEEWGRELGNENAAVRNSAATKLARQGDIARPVLEDLAQRGIGVQKDQAARMLDLLKPEKVDGPLIPTAKPDQWFRSRPAQATGNH